MCRLQDSALTFLMRLGKQIIAISSMCRCGCCVCDVCVVYCIRAKCMSMVCVQCVLCVQCVCVCGGVCVCIFHNIDVQYPWKIYMNIHKLITLEWAGVRRI